MPEVLTLPAPITFPAPPPRTRWELVRFDVEVKRRRITIRVESDNREAVTAEYSTPAPPEHPSQPTGQQLLSALNTANLPVKSLVKRILERLQTDGYLAPGSVTGTPD